MTILKINRKLFEKEIGKLDDKTKNSIIMMGTEIENITEDEIELEITPNRPDLLSYQGFKRAFLGFLGKKTGIKQYKLNKPEKNYEVVVDSSLKDIRPYTACAIVKNLNLNDEKIKEIIDIQEKLHLTLGRKRKKLAIGIYPLEKISLPITFKALEPDKIRFIPLESEKEMSGLEILQKHPTGRDYAHLLAGKEKFPVFIDANNQVLSMPPIINSQLTGKITENTKDVFVECSGFDFAILKKCLNIITTTLADFGGEIFQIQLKGNIKSITPDFSPEKNKISLENVNRHLGININEKQLKELLEKEGHNYNKGFVESSCWRTDILHEVDLIEDVAIAYGYENFSPEIPEVATIGEEDIKESLKRKISNILSGLGFLETSNYHLTTKQDQITKMNIQEKQASSFVEVEESKTDYSLLRKDLTHYSMKVLSENVDSEYPQKIFETGIVFKNEKENIKEETSLAIAITPGNFTELKQVIEYLFKMLNLKIELKEPKEMPLWFIEGRTAEISIDNKPIGFLGEVHPKILKNWKIKMPVAILEISLEEVLKK